MYIVLHVTFIKKHKIGDTSNWCGLELGVYSKLQGLNLFSMGLESRAFLAGFTFA